MGLKMDFESEDDFIIFMDEIKKRNYWGNDERRYMGRWMGRRMAQRQH